MIFVPLTVVMVGAVLALVLAIKGARPGFETDEGFFEGDREIARSSTLLPAETIARRDSGAQKIARVGLSKVRNTRKTSGTGTPFSATK